MIVVVLVVVLAYPLALVTVGVPANTIVGTTTALVLLAVEAVRRLTAITHTKTDIDDITDHDADRDADEDADQVVESRAGSPGTPGGHPTVSNAADSDASSEPGRRA